MMGAVPASAQLFVSELEQRWEPKLEPEPEPEPELDLELMSY
eukprot:COSAG06_NODE_474_length_15284_cov_124.295582_6_plen_42_part_00